MQRYRIVTDNDIDRIHETSLKIMEKVGIVFTYGPARDILAKHGAKIDGETVCFPRALVESRLSTVPSSFTLHGRNPEKNVLIDTERTAYVGPYGSPFVTDLERGRRPAKLEDFINIVKLCHSMNIDVQSHISCEPEDVDAAIRHFAMTYYNLKYSDKPLMGTVLGYEASRKCIEMVAECFGGLDAIREKPVMASIPCTLTPLSYDSKMAGPLSPMPRPARPSW